MSILIVLLATWAGAAPVASQPLSWEGGVQMLKQQNAELAAALATYESTRAQEGVARNVFFPQISGTLNYVKTDRVQGVGDGSYAATLNGSQNLFAGLQDWGKFAQAEANTRAAAATLQLTRARISAEFKGAFAGLRYAQNYTHLTHEIIDRRVDNLRLVQMRFQSGRENQGSVLLSKAYLAEAKLNDLQAQNALRVARAQLARSLGLDTQEPIELNGEVPTRDPGQRPDFESLAIESPDYRQAQAQEEASAQAISIARSPFFPSLNLTGSLGQVDSSFFPHQEDRWKVELALTLPLFNGGKDYFGTKAASRTHAASESSRINVSRQMLAKLEQAYATYTESVASLAVAQSYREAAILRAEIARKKYNNGLMSFEDWDLIENDLITRQKNYLQSSRDRVTAEASWEQTIGKGVIP